MKNAFLLLFPVAMLLQSCEEGASPYKDADKVSGSIKEISFKREVPCEDGSGTCMDYTVCEENKVERTFTKDVEIYAAIVDGLVIAKSDYINLQFSMDLPDEISSEFLYPVDEFFAGICEVSDKSAMVNQAHFYYRDNETDAGEHYISCMSKSAGLTYIPDLDYMEGECVPNYKGAHAGMNEAVGYLYADRDVNIFYENVDDDIVAERINLKLKKGWNMYVSRKSGEWTSSVHTIPEFGFGYCQCIIPVEMSTDDIPSDCEWVIIDDNEMLR